MRSPWKASQSRSRSPRARRNRPSAAPRDSIDVCPWEQEDRGYRWHEPGGIPPSGRIRPGQTSGTSRCHPLHDNTLTSDLFTSYQLNNKTRQTGPKPTAARGLTGMNALKQTPLTHFNQQIADAFMYVRKHIPGNMSKHHHSKDLYNQNAILLC